MPPEGFETWAKCPATGPLSGSERLRRPLLCSVAGHFLLASLGLLGTLTHRQVSVWGEALGGAATVRLVVTGMEAQGGEVRGAQAYPAEPTKHDRSSGERCGRGGTGGRGDHGPH